MFNGILLQKQQKLYWFLFLPPKIVLILKNSITIFVGAMHHVLRYIQLLHTEQVTAAFTISGREASLILYIYINPTNNRTVNDHIFYCVFFFYMFHFSCFWGLLLYTHISL